MPWRASVTSHPTTAIDPTPLRSAGTVERGTTAVYLKSLTLKGFKSFADKTAMVFDPGLTVVVGPNGSGKSNVADAILWVLGEQSAKQLRGQAMEDVIFSGSSARNAVGLAEVTLVLDNSDYALPVDFSEVAITRRMYRSGESEYLINGAPSRLMDITDILHDTGLGKDTHSIISQGKLDSILSSRPEERRALIEEAADISKHRRRKLRSERKLASMDDNLAKAKVVEREIMRQLKPLERQVDKAMRSRDLQAELSELATVLAVDDLRRLQEGYEALSARGREAEAAVELAQYRVDEKTRELEKLQSLLEQKGLFVGDLGEQRRRMQDALGRMESDMRLLEEKGKNMVARLSEMRMQLSSAEKQKSDTALEHERLVDELSDARVRLADLDGKVAELAEGARAAHEAREKANSEAGCLGALVRESESRADRETLAYAKLEDQVSNAEVEDQMYASRLAQIEDVLKTCSSALGARASDKDRAEESLAVARESARSLSSSVPALEEDVAAARTRAAEARERLSNAQATYAALRSVDAEVEAQSPLASALAEGAHAQSVECRLGDLIRVESGLETLIERLLGDDLSALVVCDGDAACRLADEAGALAGTEGRATIVSRSVPTGRRSDPDAPGSALVDHMDIEEGSRTLIEALLGDVRLVDTAAQALRFHESNPDCTFVTVQGACVLPDGRCILGATKDAGRGVLERKRRIRALEDGMDALEEEQRRSTADLDSAEARLSETQSSLVAVRGDIASLSGEVTSITSEIGRLTSQRDHALSEKSQVEQGRAEALFRAQEARSLIEGHRQAAFEARKEAASFASQLEEAQMMRKGCVEREERANSQLADARLQRAMVFERASHLDERVRDMDTRLSDLGRRIEATRLSSRSLEVVRLRVDPLYDRYHAIYERALAWAARLKDRASLAEADSDSLKKTILDARASVSGAGEELDRSRAAANEVKVDLGRLEVQVENAVARITGTGAILDEALLLPAPENRDECERRVADLERQISEIGPVNEVAMDEYAKLKQRADYIVEQVDDLERARASLKKITAAIERKMRTQFLLVFGKVNENFSEIFSTLFPGGAAHLEMTDPDRLDETGIEVVAQPRGKRLAKMTLLSGGEKSLTALALLFAVYKARTTPFYVFDEVEAALDDSNLSKLLGAIDTLKETTQLIVISHQRRTMEQADVLYGVSMKADGVSHVVSQRLDRTSGKVVDA